MVRTRTACSACFEGHWEQPSQPPLLSPAPTGARQLFLGDVNSSSAKFEPLFRFFAFEVAMGPDRGHLEQLPPTARSQLLATVASFLPYYCDPKVSPVVAIVIVIVIMLIMSVNQ